MRIEFPDDMRECTMRRGRDFWGSLWALVRFGLFFAIFGACLLALFVAPPRLQAMLIWCAATALYTACLILGVRRNLKADKFYGQPYSLAFDEEYTYLRAPVLEQRFRWEYCSGWNETRHDIVMHMGNNRVRWPKHIWTPEELEAIRRNLRAHALPAKKQSKAPKTETS